MNWYTFLRHLKESGVQVDTDMIIQLSNRDYTLAVSTYHLDEWIRLTSKHFTSFFYWRPFVDVDTDKVTELKERMTRAGFRRLVDE